MLNSHLVALVFQKIDPIIIFCFLFYIFKSHTSHHSLLFRHTFFFLLPDLPLLLIIILVTFKNSTWYAHTSFLHAMNSSFFSLFV